MSWSISFVIIVIPLLVALGVYILRAVKDDLKIKKFTAPLPWFFGGTFLSTYFLCWTLHVKSEGFEISQAIKLFFLTLFDTFRTFTMNMDFDFIVEKTSSIDGALCTLYLAYSAFILALAPLLTFGVVLSFFKNVSAYAKYIQHYNSDVYVFSELNEKSLSIARSIENKHPIFVFADVYSDDDEYTSELISQAKAMHGVCFKKDIRDINLNFHNSKTDLSFFLIGEDESENIEQTMSLASVYENRPNTRIYVFSKGVEGELLLSSKVNENLKIYRINRVRSLLNGILYDQGYKLFYNATPVENGENLISAVILGFGRYGQEMTKALAWYCQMDGYNIEINCFDNNPDAKNRFCAQYPEFMSPKLNGADVPFGEARYKISIHNTDIKSKNFVEEIAKIKTPTYILVALGDDELNIETAINLRILTRRLGINSQIQAIVYNTNKRKALENVKNYSNDSYDIEFIGDVESFYSEKVIVNSQLEKEALERHKLWGDEQSFWQYEYNYRSSIASAMHKKLKLVLGIPGADKPIEERTEEEKRALRVIEHRRWNAYMRSEGYCYGEKRDNLAKIHHCLVPFDDLPEKEQLKDDD